MRHKPGAFAWIRTPRGGHNLPKVGAAATREFPDGPPRKETVPGRATYNPAPILPLVFLLSGFSALLYQVVWQRVLFSVYGIDVTSVAIVVTAFMLGLGVGSLLGGALSRRVPRSVLPLFGAFELGIGLFGLFSLDLFAGVASFTLGASHAATAVLTFLLVLLPTTFMGATLPLLVQHATNRSGSVGRSVGTLYFVNTLGAALGSFAAATLLLRLLGLRATTQAAGVLNLLLGAAILLALRRREAAP